jgi:protein-S-isoprenylcysteine O-methyltransferase Ste14
MIRDWIYNHPTGEVGTTIVVLSVILSWIGLFVFDRYVNVSMRSRHNDVAGFIIAIIGVVYAVLLAFIAVAAWASFDGANRIVQQEANLVGNLYRDSVAVPEPLRGEMRHHIRRYLEHVIEKEWPAQQMGEIEPHGWVALQRLHRAIVGIDAQTRSQQVIEEEMLRTLNDLYNARRSRLLAAADGIPDTIWSILVLGGVITVGFTYFFGMPSMRMHYAMTGLLAVSLALVMVLIISLDWPFRGEVSISPEAYEAVQQTMQQPGAGAVVPEPGAVPAEK